MRFMGLMGVLGFLAVNSTAVLAVQPKKFHSWTVSCSIDPVDDKKLCSMDQDLDITSAAKHAIVSFTLSRGPKDNQPQLMVFSDALQWSEPAYIRVDRNAAHRSQNNKRQSRDVVIFSNSESIISEMRQGKVMFVRFTNRHTQTPYDVDFDLQGFNEALDYLTNIKE